jgi:integrase
MEGIAKNGRLLSSFDHWKGQSRYRKTGKILTPMTDKDFIKYMTEGNFKRKNYRPFPVLLYYSAVRREEARRVTPENFTIEVALRFSVGKRLKHGIVTPPLYMPLDLPFMSELTDLIENTDKKDPLFPFSKKTSYNIMDFAGFHYSHYCRLSRITNFFLDGWTIAQVHSWTGLSLTALNYYLGLVDIEKMGKSLAK